jgi:hypothetical protein
MNKESGVREINYILLTLNLSHFPLVPYFEKKNTHKKHIQLMREQKQAHCHNTEFNIYIQNIDIKWLSSSMPISITP